MKAKTILLVLPFFLLFQSFNYFKSDPVDKVEKKSIYYFKVKDNLGEDFDFESLKGKKIMIVNTASKCGLAESQFKALEEVYKKYSSKNFVVIAFPSNDFKESETGSLEEITKIYHENFNVTFPIMEKISVKGKNANEVYKFLTDKHRNGVHSCGVLWNFQKYLINENGVLEKIVDPKKLATDKEIVDWINK
jgi:glutathione peroxidase